MRKYYILIKNEEKGPFTFEELKTKNVTKQTYIWYEGLDDWEKLENLPEIFKEIRSSKLPPPPPSSDNTKSNKTEISGHVKVTNEKVKNATIEKLKPDQKTLKILMIWLAFHFFAMLFSYSNVDIFNSSSSPDTSSFWPFVEIISCDENFYESEASKRRGVEWRRSNPGLGSSRQLEGEYKTECELQGIFYEYDWSEFIFYVGGASLLFIIVRVSDQEDN